MTAATGPATRDISLGELAYNRLLALVVSGELQPGARVTERGLQARLNLGASPVRDALARLDNEGLVLTLPRRGYQICPLSLQSIDDVFAVWRIIGPAMVALAYRRLGPDGVQTLRAEVLAAISDDDTPEVAARKAWMGVSHATANWHLIDTFARLESHLARILFLTADFLESGPRPGRSHHESVLDTLLLDDSDVMERKTLDAIDAFYKNVLAVVRQFPSVMRAELSFSAS